MVTTCSSPGPGPAHFSYEGGARRELLAQRERSSVDSQDSASAPLSSPHHDQVSSARCEHATPSNARPAAVR